MIIVLICFKSPRRKVDSLTFREKLAAMDLPGALLLTCGLTCLVLGLQLGSIYNWSDSRAWGCLCGFGLITVIFVGIQFRCGENSTIPPRIIKQRTIASGCIFTALVAMVLSTYIAYLPSYSLLKENNIYYTIPYMVSTVLASLIIGVAITKVGYYNPFIWGGSVIFAVGSGLLYLLDVGDYAGTWIGYQLIAGIGAGACIQVPFLSTQVVLSRKDMPKGIALITFFNALGGIISSPIIDTIFSNDLMQQLEARVPLLNADVIVITSPANIHNLIPPQYLALVLEAYDRALSKTFIFPIVAACFAFLCSLAFEWKNVRNKGMEMDGTA